MSKDVISFKDFLRNNSIELPMSFPTIDDDDDFTQEDLIYTDLESDKIIEDNEYIDDFNNDEPHFDNITEPKQYTTLESSEFYKLYQDINENFVCDIHIDGVNIDEVIPRLIIESENVSLMFKGFIEDGKCKIPVDKLSILQEGQVGKIKLEVVADNTIFTPWEDTYRIHKKVKTIFR